MVPTLIALTIAFQPNTTVVLGLAERDLTGDGKPEVLRVQGVGRTQDHLDATFTIESAGKIIYTFRLQPWSRARLKEFGPWFVANEKFQRPTAFVDGLRAMAPLRVAEIPDVIAGEQQASETRSGSEIWEEILESPVTIFTFSPGGDEIVAIGWSARAGRFYRLLQCC